MFNGAEILQRSTLEPQWQTHKLGAWISPLPAFFRFCRLDQGVQYGVWWNLSISEISSFTRLWMLAKSCNHHLGCLKHVKSFKNSGMFDVWYDAYIYIYHLSNTYRSTGMVYLPPEIMGSTSYQLHLGVPMPHLGGIWKAIGAGPWQHQKFRSQSKK